MSWATFWATLCTNSSGTDVTILKMFTPNKIAKKFAFLTENKAKLS
jgi:hypothetical protein